MGGASGACSVAAFVEKPDAATAAGYLASGAYLWNSGMFVVGAGRLVEEMRRYCPEVLAAAEAALAGARADLDFLRLEATAFGSAPSISLDYAVMERTERAAVIPAEVGWHDLGSWPALWSVAAKDGSGNAVVGEAHLRDVRGSYLRSDDGRLIAGLGLEDMIVVSTHDALLVAPRSRAVGDRGAGEGACGVGPCGGDGAACDPASLGELRDAGGGRAWVWIWGVWIWRVWIRWLCCELRGGLLRRLAGMRPVVSR